MSILSRLYHQEAISESENGVSETPEQKEALAAVIAAEDELIKSMTKEQRALYEEFRSRQSKLESLEEEKWFKHGFILAYKLRQEIEEADHEDGERMG